MVMCSGTAAVGSVWSLFLFMTADWFYYLTETEVTDLALLGFFALYL